MDWRYAFAAAFRQHVHPCCTGWRAGWRRALANPLQLVRHHAACACCPPPELLCRQQVGPAPPPGRRGQAEASLWRPFDVSSRRHYLSLSCRASGQLRVRFGSASGPPSTWMARPGRSYFDCLQSEAGQTVQPDQFYECQVGRGGAGRRTASGKGLGLEAHASHVLLPASQAARACATRA